MPRVNEQIRSFPWWLIITFTVGTAALLSGGAWFYTVQRGQLLAAAEADLLTIARLKVDQIRQWRGERIGDASILAESQVASRQVAGLLRNGAGGDAGELLATLRSYMRNYRYEEIFVVDAEGRGLLGVTGAAHPLAAEATRALAEAFDGGRAVLSDLHGDPANGEPHLDAIAPFFSAENDGRRPIGAIVLHCDASDFLFPLIQTWPGVSESAETLLVRRDGEGVLYLNNLRHRKNTALRLRIPLESAEVPAVMAVTGRTGIVYGTDYRGVYVAAALLPVPGTDWHLVAKVDRSEILARWRPSAALILVCLLGLAGGAAVVAGLIWQRTEKERFRALLHAESGRRASEERYRVTLLSVGDGVIATDCDGTVRMMNPVAEELTGWRSADAVGRPLEEIFNIVHEETRGRVENPVRRVVRDGAVVGLANHTLLISREGKERSIADSGAPIPDEKGGVAGVVLVFRDVTEERRHQHERETTLELLSLINGSADLHGLIRAITDLLQKSTGFEAVGIRLKEGDDFPYFETRGFTAEFVKTERFLCERDADGRAVLDAAGIPVLDCMCGDILRGKFDPSKPFFTPKGSFWSNSTTELLAGTAEKDRMARTRNRCNGEGYESVALVPLRHGDSTFGLLQFNDRSRNRFTPELLDFLERAADHIAMALSHRRMERALAESEEHYRSLFENMLNGFAYCRMIFDGEKPVDFVFLEVNRAFATLTGLRDVVGRKISELVPGFPPEDRQVLEKLGAVAARGIPGSFEIPVRSMDMWLSVAAYGPRPGHFVMVFDVITERKRAEAQRQLLASVVDQAVEMILITDVEGAIQYVNPAFETVTGYARAEAVGRTPRILKSGEQDSEFYRAMWGTIEGGKPWKGRMTNRRKNGTPFPADVTISPVMGPDGSVVNYVATIRDISRELQLEDQLRQAQKMESVGRLAGGVAHDFNNMLHVIGNYVELALADAEAAGALGGHLRQIRSAAERSVELTGQLLAFARKQTINPKVIDLNTDIPALMKMLRRLIGESIDLQWRPGKAAAKVKLDPAQLDQILANLVLNAKDAIDGIGKITIETGGAAFDEEYCAVHAGFLPGEYVQLGVSDNGIGMEKAVMSHLFEPFYTTKPMGKGTGLGLATVYGIVKQNHGFINVYSEPGRGTTFKLYLPRVEADAAGEEPDRAGLEPRGGTETILVVEDEEAILQLSRIMLVQLGYTVITARSPAEAIKSAREAGAPIHLVITDVVMPEMNGRELVRELRAGNSGMKCLFMSGYTANVIAHQGVLEEGVHFLPKPFSMADLAGKIREAIDG